MNDNSFNDMRRLRENLASTLKRKQRAMQQAERDVHRIKSELRAVEHAIEHAEARTTKGRPGKTAPKGRRG